MQRALNAARRAVELDPNSPIAHYALANAHYFMNEVDAFFPEAERALALNPNNTEILAAIAGRYSLAGNLSRGLLLAKKSMALNPSYPGWYLMPLILDNFLKGNFEAAIADAKKWSERMPRYWYPHWWLMLCYAQLSQYERARVEFDEILRLNPNFKKDPMRDFVMWVKSPQLLQQMSDWMRKAGVEIPAK